MTDQTPPSEAPDAPPPPPPPAAPAAGTASGAGSAPSGSARFFLWLRSLNLTRDPGWLGGVASGLGLRLRIDPIIVRGILVVLAILAFPVALVYALAWAFLPDHTGKIHAEEVSRGRVESGFIGAAVLFGIALLGLGDGGPWGWNDGYRWGWDGGWMHGSPGMAFAVIASLFWTLLVIGGLIALIVWLVRRSKTSAATPAQGAPGATFVAGASAASPTTASAAHATATAPLPGTVADSDMDAWRAQQNADRAQRDAFAGSDEAARRQADAERIRLERVADYERRRALRRRTRSHPLFSIAAIGLALLAGAVATLALGGAEVERGDVVIGFAVALGVLGAAIVVNGVRGKRSGGSTGAAILVLIGLVIASVSPGAGSGLRLVGSGEYQPRFTDDAEQSFVVGAGSTVIDLRDYWDGTRAGSQLEGTITVVTGAGDVTIGLPDQGAVEWEIISGAGDTLLVTGDDDGSSIPRDGGFSATGETERTLTLEVIAGAGDILFITEGIDR